MLVPWDLETGLVRNFHHSWEAFVAMLNAWRQPEAPLIDQRKWWYAQNAAKNMRVSSRAKKMEEIGRHRFVMKQEDFYHKNPHLKKPSATGDSDDEAHETKKPEDGLGEEFTLEELCENLALQAQNRRERESDTDFAKRMKKITRQFDTMYRPQKKNKVQLRLRSRAKSIAKLG